MFVRSTLFPEKLSRNRSRRAKTRLHVGDDYPRDGRATNDGGCIDLLARSIDEAERLAAVTHVANYNALGIRREARTNIGRNGTVPFEHPHETFQVCDKRDVFVTCVADASSGTSLAISEHSLKKTKNMQTLSAPFTAIDVHFACSRTFDAFVSRELLTLTSEYLYRGSNKIVVKDKIPPKLNPSAVPAFERYTIYRFAAVYSAFPFFIPLK